MTSSNQLLRRAQQHRFTIPIATAGGVLAVLLVQRILLTIVGVFGALVSGSFGGIWFPLGGRLVGLDLVFAVEVLVVLCIVRPVLAGLRLGSVVVRSVLAAAAGSIFVFLAILVTGIYDSVGGVLGTQVGIQGDTVRQAVAVGLYTGGTYFVFSGPVVILAGVLLWIWLTRQTRTHPITGFLDEV